MLNGWRGGERARPDWVRAHPWAPWAAVLSVCFGAFMGQLDASIVTLTYPALRSEFAATLGAVEWVSLVYLLVLVALLVPVGRAADSWGRKRLYLQGFVVFTVASALSALAPNLGWLVAFRALQAVGAALLQANSVALVTTSVPPARVRTALGVQAAAQALGLALGPTLGGLLVAGWGWRSVFWVNVPVGVVAVLLGRYLLPRSRELRPAPAADTGGFLLLTVASSAALLGLSGLSGLPLPGVVLAGLAVAAMGAAWALHRHERRTPAPLLDPAVLAVPVVPPGLLGAMGAYLVLFGPLVLVPIVLTEHGLSLQHAGLILTALPAGFALAATGGGLLPARWGNPVRVTAGGLLAAVALAGLAAVPPRPGWLAPLLFAVGLGVGVVTPANNAAVMTAVPRAVAGLAGGLVNVTRALGTSLGVALTALGLHWAPRWGLAPQLVVALALAGVALIVAGSGVALARSAGPPSPPAGEGPR